MQITDHIGSAAAIKRIFTADAVPIAGDMPIYQVLVDLGLPPVMANPLVASSFPASLREEVHGQQDLLNSWARKEAV